MVAVKVVLEVVTAVNAELPVAAVAVEEVRRVKEVEIWWQYSHWKYQRDTVMPLRPPQVPRYPKTTKVLPGLPG